MRGRDHERVVGEVQREGRRRPEIDVEVTDLHESPRIVPKSRSFSVVATLPTSRPARLKSLTLEASTPSAGTTVGPALPPHRRGPRDLRAGRPTVASLAVSGASRSAAPIEPFLISADVSVLRAICLALMLRSLIVAPLIFRTALLAAS